MIPASISVFLAAVAEQLKNLVPVWKRVAGNKIEHLINAPGFCFSFQGNPV